MQLNTKHFGLVEVNENDIIDFPEGLPGFENLKKFVLLGEVDEEPYFDWLQSIEDTNIAFVMIKPRQFMPQYTIKIEESEVKCLEIKDENNVLIYAIVVIPEDVAKISANLKAPVLINTENNKGKQIVMENSEYTVRHYIIEQLKRIGG